MHLETALYTDCRALWDVMLCSLVDGVQTFWKNLLPYLRGIICFL